MKTVKESFEVTDVVVDNWHTEFTITSLDVAGSVNPECLIHHIGNMAGKELEGIKGLKFTVAIQEES